MESMAREVGSVDHVSLALVLVRAWLGQLSGDHGPGKRKGNTEYSGCALQLCGSPFAFTEKVSHSFQVHIRVWFAERFRQHALYPHSGQGRITL